MVSGLQLFYSYEWNIGVYMVFLEGLIVGDYIVIIIGVNGLFFMDIVAFENFEVEILVLEVEWLVDNLVCWGMDVVFYVQVLNEEVFVCWEIVDGNLLQEIFVLMIEGIQFVYIVYVKMLYCGCEFELIEVMVQVY